MCEGEAGGGTIVCQHDFHFLAKNPVQALQFHLATIDPYFLWYATRPFPWFLMFP